MYAGAFRSPPGAADSGHPPVFLFRAADKRLRPARRTDGIKPPHPAPKIPASFIENPRPDCISVQFPRARNRPIRRNKHAFSPATRKLPVGSPPRHGFARRFAPVSPPSANFSGTPCDFFWEVDEKCRNSQSLFIRSSTHAWSNPEVNSSRGGSYLLPTSGSSDPTSGHPPSKSGFVVRDALKFGSFWQVSARPVLRAEILQFTIDNNLLKKSSTGLFQMNNNQYVSHNKFCSRIGCCKYNCRNYAIQRPIFGKAMRFSRQVPGPDLAPVFSQFKGHDDHVHMTFTQENIDPIFINKPAAQHNLHFNFFHGDCPWGYFLQGEPSWDHSTACN